ncbi:FUSC family protein [Enterococcus sp. BWM-S5]|uniref:FUSC family protein n=1 Tax=Enterococcus larvae TaxID=2794352 RepID=A0ABS4CMK9_9ENTE|nr:aromatic acid exporter family protein [Enterococcus larvae]MBP1047004.1 FUSC family protein [Enterococcus larvae]
MFGFKIGLRTIKTGISVFLCILISLLFHREMYVVSAITAVFTLREDMINTLTFGKHRVAGNTIGALTSVVVIFIFELFGDSDMVQLLAIPLTIVVMIAVLVRFNFQEGVVGATATLLTIVFMIPEDSSYVYALNRVVDSFIGMGVAIGVNYLLPSKMETVLSAVQQRFNKEDQQELD